MPLTVFKYFCYRFILPTYSWCLKSLSWRHFSLVSIDLRALL